MNPQLTSDEEWDRRMMRLALEVASWSKDPSTKVGAVITDESHRVLGLGYNGFPRGVVDSPERLNDRDTKYSLIVHAELNAILNATTNLEGAILYVTMAPCCECAKAIIQSGVAHVVIDLAAPNLRWAKIGQVAREMMEEAGIEVTQL